MAANLRHAAPGIFARALALCFAAGQVSLFAAAQSVTATTGATNGIVTDSTTAAVPGVTVSLSGPSVMTTRADVSDEVGAYRFSAVPPGEYALTFELSGFGTIIREAVDVRLGFTATINVEMSPGAVTDRVTVSGSPVVDLSSTAVTTHFDSEKLASLPGARDIFAILANTPGVAQAKMDVGGACRQSAGAHGGPDAVQGRSTDLRFVEQRQLALVATRSALIRVQAEQRVQRVNLHLALGGSFEPRPAEPRDH